MGADHERSELVVKTGKRGAEASARVKGAKKRKTDSNKPKKQPNNHTTKPYKTKPNATHNQTHNTNQTTKQTTKQNKHATKQTKQISFLVFLG